MLKLADLKVKLFTDGAEKSHILEMAKQPWIAGFTTNPSLLKKAGVSRLFGMGCKPKTGLEDALRKSYDW